MQNSAPMVSVLMTAFNREKYIAEAIESVLSSTYSNFELIITDDCSRDRTVEIARSYAEKDARVKVFENEKNLGDYSNRNRAASHAKGKYIKYLDSDDVMYSYTLQIMVDYMEEFPEAGFGLSAVHDNKPYPIAVDPKKAYLEHFFTWGHFDRAPGSSIIKRASFEKVGGFTGERMIGDFQLWLALGREFQMVKIPPNLTWNREHEGQESKADYAKLYEELREKATDAALAHPSCPLSEEEKKAVLKHINAQKRKQAMYRFIKKIAR
jgi:hypothetical protein